MTYHCELCGDDFESTWSDEEASAEYVDVFPDAEPPEDAAVVCDDCYKALGL